MISQVNEFVSPLRQILYLQSLKQFCAMPQVGIEWLPPGSRLLKCKLAAEHRLELVMAESLLQQFCEPWMGQETVELRCDVEPSTPVTLFDECLLQPIDSFILST
jgi:hypothetical protein